MTLANAFIDGINRLYSVGGVSATYTDSDATASTVTVIIDYDLSNYGDTVEVAQATATISVRTSEVSDMPRRGDTFLVNAALLVVGGSLQSDELEHTVLVS